MVEYYGYWDWQKNNVEDGDNVFVIQATPSVISAMTQFFNMKGWFKDYQQLQHLELIGDGIYAINFSKSDGVANTLTELEVFLKDGVKELANYFHEQGHYGFEIFTCFHNIDCGISVTFRVSVDDEEILAGDGLIFVEETFTNLKFINLEGLDFTEDRHEDLDEVLDQEILALMRRFPLMEFYEFCEKKKSAGGFYNYPNFNINKFML